MKERAHSLSSFSAWLNKGFDLRAHATRMADARTDPEISPSSIFLAVFHSFVFRLPSFQQLDSELSHSHLQSWIGVERAFGDDTLRYSLCGFDLDPLESMLVDVNRRLKRGKAFERGGYKAARMAHFCSLLPSLVLVLEPTHQFPVEVGNLLQGFFHPVIVFNPSANLLDLIAVHRRAPGPTRLVQGHAKIPNRPVALTASTLAVRIAAVKYRSIKEPLSTSPSGGRSLVGPGDDSAGRGRRAWRVFLFPPLGESHKCDISCLCH